MKKIIFAIFLLIHIYSITTNNTAILNDILVKQYLEFNYSPIEHNKYTTFENNYQLWDSFISYSHQNKNLLLYLSINYRIFIYQLFKSNNNNLQLKGTFFISPSYFTYSIKRNILSIGFHQYNIGYLGDFSFNDQINQIDNKNIFNQRKIPLFSIDYIFHFNNIFSAQLTYVPYKARDVDSINYPQIIESRLPTSLLTKLGVTLPTPKEVEVPYGSYYSLGYFSLYYKKNNIENFFLFKFDNGKYIGMDTEIRLKTNSNTNLPADVYEIELLRERAHWFGGGTKITLPKKTIAMEVGYLLTEDVFEDHGVDHNLDTWGQINPEIWIGFDINNTKIKRHNFRFTYTLKYSIKYDDKHITDYLKYLTNLSKYSNEIQNHNFLADIDEGSLFYVRQIVKPLTRQTEGVLNKLEVNYSFNINKKLKSLFTDFNYYLPLIYDKYRFDKYGNIYQRYRLGGIKLNSGINIEPIEDINFIFGIEYVDALEKNIITHKYKRDDLDFLGMKHNETVIYLKFYYTYSLNKNR